jgi:hypothetical protein
MVVEGNVSLMSGRQISIPSFPYDTNASFWTGDESLLASGLQETYAQAEPIYNQNASGSVFAYDKGTLWSFQGFSSGQTVDVWDLTWATRKPWPTVASLGTAANVRGDAVTDGRYLYAAAEDRLRGFNVKTRTSVSSIINRAFGFNSYAVRGIDIYRGRLYVAGDADEINVFTIAGATGGLVEQIPVTAHTVFGTTLAASHRHLFLTEDDQLEIVKLGNNLDGGGASSVGVLQHSDTISDPTVVGDLLLVREGMGIVVYDLTPLFAGTGLPVFAGSIGSAGALYPGDAKLEVAGPWAFLRGRSYRAFDLR